MIVILHTIPLFEHIISMRFIFRLFRDFRIQIIINFLLLTFLLLSIVSYSSEDPSWNNYSENYPSNFMGSAGSIVSDIMLQLFGAASIFYIVLMALWIKTLWQNRFMDSWARKILQGIFAISLLSSSFGMLEFKFLPANFGGIIGVVTKP
jgi:S-DNA-T family DNA segregation ATPase FtsK/SpoIIIE